MILIINASNILSPREINNLIDIINYTNSKDESKDDYIPFYYRKWDIWNIENY